MDLEKHFTQSFSQGLESCSSYSRNILEGKFHEEANRHTLKDQRRKLAEVTEHTTLERTRKQRRRRKNFKDSCNFFKNRQRLMKKSYRRRELEEFVHFVKDFCRR
jgi:hypothetical protein